MSYNTLTAQYRPQLFSEVVGQEVVCKILSKASRMDLIAPAYILSGTRGVGKTTLARIFAKALNCIHAPIAEPCNNCINCKRITKGSFVDVIELDAASNRSIDDIRELRNTMQFAPMEGKYKVFILDEAHMLTKEAYNALLKSLEEPPKKTVFILASTDVQKFPVTIISRCQHLVLRSIPFTNLVKNIKNILDKEHIEYEEQAVELVARRANGSMRDALSLLGQCLVLSEKKLMLRQVEQSLGVGRREIYYNFLYAIIKRDTVAIVSLINTMQQEAIDIRFFLQELTQLWRNLFLLKKDKGSSFSLFGISEEEGEQLLQMSQYISLSQIHASWQMTLDGQKRIMESLEPGVALELLLLTISSIPELLNMKSLSNAEEYVLSQRENNEDAMNTQDTMEQRTSHEGEKYKTEKVLEPIVYQEGIRHGFEQKLIDERSGIEGQERENTKKESSVRNTQDTKEKENILLVEQKEKIEEMNLQDENRSNKKSDEEYVSSKNSEEIKALFTRAIENNKKLTQYKTMYMSSYEFVDTTCNIYPISGRAYVKLVSIQNDIEKVVQEIIGNYDVVIHKASDATKQIEKQIAEHPAVILLEQEFSTKCEYETTAVKYMK
ncbi:MAG: DNA polymerase III subunit gamma/tau [Desulfovibrionaceae bacterium]